MKHRQQGITILGFVGVLAVLGCALFIAAQLFPLYLEFHGVKSALKSMAEEGAATDKDPLQIKKDLLRRLDVNYSESVEAEDITVTRVDNGWEVAVDYQAEKHMVGNIDVVVSFATTQDLTKGGEE